MQKRAGSVKLLTELQSADDFFRILQAVYDCSYLEAARLWDFKWFQRLRLIKVAYHGSFNPQSSRSLDNVVVMYG